METNENIKERFAVRKFWWLYLILGILITGLGIFFAARPLAAFSAIQLFVIIFFLVSGIGGIISAIAGRKTMPGWGAALTLYILVTIMGLMLLLIPGLSDTLLLVFTGVGFLFEGISMIVRSCSIKNDGWVFTLILGIIVTLAALSIMGNLILSFLLIAICVAVSTISFGISCIAFSIQVKKLPE